MSIASVSGRNRVQKMVAMLQSDPDYLNKRKLALKQAAAYDKAWRAANCALDFPTRAEWISQQSWK